VHVTQPGELRAVKGIVGAARDRQRVAETGPSSAFGAIRAVVATGAIQRRSIHASTITAAVVAMLSMVKRVDRAFAASPRPPASNCSRASRATCNACFKPISVFSTRAMRLHRVTQAGRECAAPSKLALGLSASFENALRAVAASGAPGARVLARGKAAAPAPAAMTEHLTFGERIAGPDGPGPAHAARPVRRSRTSPRWWTSRWCRSSARRRSDTGNAIPTSSRSRCGVEPPSRAIQRIVFGMVRGRAFSGAMCAKGELHGAAPLGAASSRDPLPQSRYRCSAIRSKW